MNQQWRGLIFGVLLICMFFSHLLYGEDGEKAWLRYAELDAKAAQQYGSLPATAVGLDDSAVLGSAKTELIRGIRGMLGRTLRQERKMPQEPAIVLGTLKEVQQLDPALRPKDKLEGDGFWIAEAKIHGFSSIVITAASDRGVLYGVFALLAKIAQQESLATVNDPQQPFASIRWVDQWDNPNGTIERGYGGPSIFFENGSVRADLTRAGEYARLLASIGINGCNINNVNADLGTLKDDFIPQLARVADVFRPWGVKLSISVDLSSPKAIGGLDTFDPLDPKVATWWKDRVDEIYKQIPDFGGFTVKADSEGRLGPSSYGRTPADAANMLAQTLKPHGGILFYRAFVYNHRLDWTNPKNDRARAAYDIFHPLDGKFEDNVIIQIKNGPIDFQVREPASPLFSGLEKTNEVMEVQVAQEYLGQQRHLCFLPPMWKEVLDFDMHANGGNTPVKNLIAGKTFHRPMGGMVAVVNVGMDANWLGSHLAMANLYGYGRLAWNPNVSSKTIAQEWTRLTFGNDPMVVQTVTDMQLASWLAYEEYTGPLGLQTLTNITGPHYGPGVESSENNGWGQWHRADHEGVGMDRSVATGTGYVGQYPAGVAKMYESLAATPDNLLLFFHHVPYTYKLHSGKTVIQFLYDSHYEGAARAKKFVAQWESLKGRVDEQRYGETLTKFEYQAGHAIVWRDAVARWFARESGIPDAKGRVGHYPDRVEAEGMQLEGYTAVDVTPWENASGGKGIECGAASCSASFKFDRPARWYEVDVQYFDMPTGDAKFRVYVDDQLVDEWDADNHLPAIRLGGDASTRRWIAGIALRRGDTVRIEGVPDGGDHAALDYVAIHEMARTTEQKKPHRASARSASGARQ
ncbi:MAG TPA: alpha-glucuronidase family glycosyl hydrolase [Terriglobales bacterium]|nr:alpha-glucuronidase family glycosyl hydrolase [Terriglobales bacterium]